MAMECGRPAADIRVPTLQVSSGRDTRESDIPHKPGVFTGSYDSDTNGIRLLWYTKVNPEDPDDPSNRGDPSVTAFVISRTVTQSKVPSLEEAFADVTVQATEADAQGVLEYVDNKVIEGSGYTYEFRSKNANGLSDPVLLGREARRVTGRAAGITNLRVTDKRIGAITLEWDAPDQSGDNPAITGYKIHRNVWYWFGDDAVVLESNLPATATSYVDTSEELAIFWWDYIYYVTPFNAAGHSKVADIRFTPLPSDAESPDDGSSEDDTPEDDTPEAPVLGDPIRPPRPGTSATATIETAGGSVNMVVTWVDGTDGERACHSDYKVNVFYPDRALLPREPIRQGSTAPVYLAANPHDDIEINLIQHVLGVVSPHLRSLTVPLTVQVDVAGLKVRVWCGTPVLADSVLIGETPHPPFEIP